jgi:hypothetical protein
LSESAIGDLSGARGRAHRQLFAEGIPSLHGLTRLNRRNRFYYHEFYPPRSGLPASYEAMRGQMAADEIHGKIKFRERTYGGDDRTTSKCGTGSPKGLWETFDAKLAGSEPWR